MDIVEFFQLSSGKWFSHRTSHLLAAKQSEGGKSDVYVELLSKTDPDVVQLCNQQAVDPDLALCGARITWNGTITGNTQKQSGSTLLVPLANTDNPQEGNLLRQAGKADSTPVQGRYVVGSDEAVTLILDDGTTMSEERVWFASPNLRLRTTVLKQPDGFSAASFCSEIRLGVTKPADQ